MFSINSHFIFIYRTIEHVLDRHFFFDEIDRHCLKAVYMADTQLNKHIVKHSTRGSCSCQTRRVVVELRQHKICRLQLKMAAGIEYPQIQGYRIRWTRIWVWICTRGYGRVRLQTRRVFANGFLNLISEPANPLTCGPDHLCI